MHMHVHMFYIYDHMWTDTRIHTADTSHIQRNPAAGKAAAAATKLCRSRRVSEMYSIRYNVNPALVNPKGLFAWEDTIDHPPN